MPRALNRLDSADPRREADPGRSRVQPRPGEDIKRNTRKQYNAEEKIRIVLDGLRGEDSIAAFGMVKHEKDRLAGTGEEPALDEINRACDGLSQVIIPIIRALHDGPKDGTDVD